MPDSLNLPEKPYLQFLKEATEPQVKIPVEHPGVLEVPEGKKVEDLGEDHFKELIKKKGWSEISKALTNLNTWNENRDKPLSNWADNMQQKLSKWVDSQREESGNENLYEAKVPKWYLIREDEPQVKIPVEHAGVLEVPAGKKVDDLPYSHFAELAKRKGWEEISKALTNLHTWNEKRNPKLASWANDMQARLSKEFSEKPQERRNFRSDNIMLDSDGLIGLEGLDAVLEKWGKDVHVKATGQYSGKSVEELKKAIADLKKQPGDHRTKMGQLLFALRAKQGWKKHTGA